MEGSLPPLPPPRSSMGGGLRAQVTANLLEELERIVDNPVVSQRIGAALQQV